MSWNLSGKTRILNLASIFILREYEKKAPNSESKNCKKFMENPQHFFTEDLCDVMLLQYDINPKEILNSSTNINKRSKEKK